MLLNTDKIIAKEAKTSVTDAGYCHLSFSPIYYTIKQIKMTTALPCPNVYGPLRRAVPSPPALSSVGQAPSRFCFLLLSTQDQPVERVYLTNCFNVLPVLQ